MAGSDSTANATTYFIASFYGVDSKAGNYLENHAKYFDDLTRDLNGNWRITKKTLVYMVWTAASTERSDRQANEYSASKFWGFKKFPDLRECEGACGCPKLESAWNF